MLNQMSTYYSCKICHELVTFYIFFSYPIESWPSSRRLVLYGTKFFPKHFLSQINLKGYHSRINRSVHYSCKICYASVILYIFFLLLYCILAFIPQTSVVWNQLFPQSISWAKSTSKEFSQESINLFHCHQLQTSAKIWDSQYAYPEVR